MKTIRIAAVVFNAPRNRTRENLDRMEDWVAAAGRERARLICFPELGITGYGIDAEIRESAESIPGEASGRLCAMAARHAMVVLAGLAEKTADGRIWASHLVASPAGILGVYRKVHIAPPEKGLYSPGQAAPVFEAAGIRFGIQLCYDAHFPELATRMALGGAEVIFMPHASPRGTPHEKRASWMRHLPARAFDNGVFVVACNQTGAHHGRQAFPGLAMVIGPDGRVIAERAADAEALLIADLDAALLSAVREHPMRWFLPHRRPDIYFPNQ